MSPVLTVGLEPALNSVSHCRLCQLGYICMRADTGNRTPLRSLTTRVPPHEAMSAW
jgi:hypothetical protein